MVDIFEVITILFSVGAIGVVIFGMVIPDIRESKRRAAHVASLPSPPYMVLQSSWMGFNKTFAEPLGYYVHVLPSGQLYVQNLKTSYLQPFGRNESQPDAVMRYIVTGRY